MLQTIMADKLILT